MLRKSFIKRMFFSFALLVFGMLAFPFLIQLIVSLTGPHSRGTGGAVALMAGIMLKPLFLLVILYLFMLPIGKRLRGLDMNLGWLLFAFISFAASWEFLFSVGNSWGANFSVGVLQTRFPYSLMLFFGFILFISALPDKKEKRSSELPEKLAWILAGVCAVYFVIAFAPSVVQMMGSMIAYLLAFVGLKLPVLYELSNSTALFKATHFLAFIPLVIRSNFFLIFGLACCAIVVMEHRAVRQYSAPET